MLDVSDPLPRALFLCIQNAGRSQMAAAFWGKLGGEARSAGSAPATRVHDAVAETMREVGIEIGDRVPRRLTDDDAQWVEVVVTMGCGDACPYIPGRGYVDWEISDPSGQPPDVVRAIRDDVARHIEELAANEPRAD